MVRPQGSIYSHVSTTGKKTWKVEVEIGKNPDGTRRRIRRTAQTYQDAHKLKRQLLEQSKNANTDLNPNQLLGIYAHWWLREVKANKVRPATASDYEHRFRKHIQPVFGNRKLGDITARDVTGWMSQLVSDGYSVPTINGSLQVLGAIFRSAQQEGVIAHSPVAAVPRLSRRLGAPTQVQEPLSSEEGARLLEVCGDDVEGVAIATGLLLGLRRSEILGLKWKDVDLKKNTLLVARALREIPIYDQYGRGETRLELNEPKTLSSKRVVSLPGALVGRLWLLRAARVAEGNFSSEDWLVSQDGKKPTRPKTLAAMLRRRLKAAGLRHIRFHDLRHSCAVLSLAAGVRIEAVSQILGHGSIDVTKSKYAPYVAALSAEFSEAIGQHLGYVGSNDGPF